MNKVSLPRSASLTSSLMAAGRCVRIGPEDFSGTTPGRILADTARGFRYKTAVPDTARLTEFTAWCAQHITGDEKGQAQIFLDWLLPAFGQLKIADALRPV